ncbi:hypothetical protein [Streptomyces zingiberis]|uniref:Uncharacterized protein n=1 Tax=Streptomyces zingiberis TaxID=2053010 RepID=A0ABX1C3K2_9ACTN|nr:hypothetical protein [Streptomyces zingiberis]NJQ03245.1 hypothetical protein [Streptomyces zingiberis]
MSFGHQGFPGPGGSFDSSSPDWGAMADRTAARNRRRRLLMIGGGVAATAIVASVVTFGLVNGGNAEGGERALPSPDALPSEPQQPEPSFSEVKPPPPPDPREFIANAEKDTAPLSATTLFPDERMTMSSRSYAKGATDSVTNCATVASARLAPALTENGCDQVIRATYARDGVAVTVGIAIFGTEAQAAKAKEDAAGNIQSLAGEGVPVFCRATACRLTANSVGRYAYFTVSGYTSGEAVTTADTQARQAGKDVADYTFNSIVNRGEAQASQAATAQAG